MAVIQYRFHLYLNSQKFQNWLIRFRMSSYLQVTDRPRNHKKFYYTAVSQQEIIYNMFPMVEVIYFIHKFGKISNRGRP
jgi:hypothetical protein